MASQINPVIAAFLQARGQAENAVQGIKQQELLQKRLEIEKEANAAEMEWRKGQLEATRLKAEQDAKQFDLKNKIDQAQMQASAARFYLDGIKEGQSPEAMATLSQGIYPSEAIASVAPLIKSWEELRAKETEAEINKMRAQIPVQSEAALERAKATLPIELFKSDLEHQQSMEQAKATQASQLERDKLNDERQRKTVEYQQSQANARAQMRANTGAMDAATSRLAGQHDRHPIAIDAATTQTAYNTISQTPNEHSNPNMDIDLIINAVKVSDPGVSVRSVEAENVRKWSQGLPQNLKVQVERIINKTPGALLTPEARQNIKDAAANAAISHYKVYLPYRDTIADKVALQKRTTKNDPTVQTIVGTGFLPPNIVKVDKTYYWRWDNPNKPRVALFTEK